MNTELSSGLADWSDLCGRVPEMYSDSKNCQLMSLTWGKKNVLLVMLTNRRNRYMVRDLREDRELHGDGLIMRCWRHPKKMHSKKLGMSGGFGPIQQERTVEHQSSQMCQYLQSEKRKMVKWRSLGENGSESLEEKMW